MVKQEVRLADLLKFKGKLEIKDEDSKVISTVWIRLMGDEDIQAAYRQARIVSAARRDKLRDPESDEAKDILLQLKEQDRDYLTEIIITARENRFAAEAPVIATREELPTLDEVAARPDAPTLEEQEILDKGIEEVNEKFLKAVEDYIQTKVAETRAELAEYDDEKILELARKDMEIIQPLQVFMQEVNDQKGFRGTFLDASCKTRGFDSVEEFKDSHPLIKSQIIAKYDSLEIGSEDLKK
jgi:hypothetical protein